jgi:hypothetical protein
MRPRVRFRLNGAAWYIPFATWKRGVEVKVTSSFKALKKLGKRAIARAHAHEIHVLLLWIGRATVGWRLHRATEEFWSALEEKFTNNPGFYQDVWRFLPQPEAKELFAALLNRATLPRLLSKFAILIPVVLLFFEVRDLERHNNILQTQVIEPVNQGIESRDLNALVILSCSAPCPPQAVRKQALRLYVRDERNRILSRGGSSTDQVGLDGLNLSRLVFDIRDDLSNLAFTNSNFDDTTFENVNIKHSGISYSTLNNTRFRGSVLDNFVVLARSTLNGIRVENSCLNLLLWTDDIYVSQRTETGSNIRSYPTLINNTIFRFVVNGRDVQDVKAADDYAVPKC